MNVAVCLDHRFFRTPDGAIWTQVAFDYRFWECYLEVFDSVRVAARVRDVPWRPPNYVRVDGRAVTVRAIPDYLGPWQYLIKARMVRHLLEDAVGPSDAVILRVPSQLGNSLHSFLARRGHPYAVQVVGDPWDVFAPGAVGGIGRPFFRRYFAQCLRQQCRGAIAASYVTQHMLQRRYALGREADVIGIQSTEPLSIAVSDVLLPTNPAPVRKWADMPDTTRRILLVGSLAQPYKGVDVAIGALVICRQAGIDARLTVVGDGRMRTHYQRLAARLGAREHVCFKGQLSSGDAVFAEMDQSDLMVMPSRTEGLPRALIEAMARGLPCLGSNVGGIPELLDQEDLVPSGDCRALASAIQQVFGDPARMRQMSNRNRNRADDFRREVMASRRRVFLAFVRQQTKAWWRLRNGDTRPTITEDLDRRGMGFHADVRVGAYGN